MEKPAKTGEITMSGDVQIVYTNWNRAKNHDAKAYSRCMRNWRSYMPLYPEEGLGQWPVDTISGMSQQGRRLVQHNLIRPTIDSLAKTMMDTPTDPDFIPVNYEMTSLTRALKSALYSDKELLDWKIPYYNQILAGLIYAGDIKFFISDDYHDLGNIGFKYCLPGSVFYDPAWKTSQTKDCRVCWHELWMNVEDIAETYRDSGEYIKWMAKLMKKDGVLYGENTGATPFATNSDVWGSFFRVISEYRMYRQYVTAEYLRCPEISPERDILLPKGDSEFKIHWLNQNVVNEQGQAIWRPELIYEKEEQEKICWVKTICPGLVNDKPLENKKTEVQINCLPFKRWSAAMIHGECFSIVDSLIDPQVSVNNHESTLEYKMRVEGGGGAQWVDKEGFAELHGPGGYEDFLKNRNKPTKNFITKPGYLLQNPNGPARPVQANSGFPAEIYRHLEHLIERIWPNVSKVTPAKLGQMDQGQMSGRLYNMMKIQADNQSYTMVFTLRMLWNEIYEGYIYQAAQTYSNEGIPRIFTLKGGKEKIILNEQVKMADGTIGIRNDASMLKQIRHKIIISETQEGPSERANNVAMFMEILSKTPPNKLGTMNKIFNQAISNVDAIPEEDRAELEEIGGLEYELDKKKLQFQIMQIDDQMKQLQAKMAMPSLPAPPAATAAPAIINRTNEPQPQGGESIPPETVPQGQGVTQ